MADRSADRVASSSSSVTDAEHFDENEKIASSNASFVKVKAEDDVEAGDDVERAELLPEEHVAKPAPVKDNSTRTAIIWMVVNTLATIGIVSYFNPFCNSMAC